MGIDAQTGIDFGDVKYTVTKAKGNDKNGKFTVDGYQVTLENGVSLFIAKDNIQSGAKITVEKDSSGIYKNDVKFTGFKNISIFGSNERDRITVDNGNGVHVRTDNDNKGDSVIFTNSKNQNNSWIGGKTDIFSRGSEGSRSIVGNDTKLEYKEAYDSRVGGKDHAGYNYGEKKFGI